MSKEPKHFRPISIIYHKECRTPLLAGSMDQVQLRGFLNLITIIFVANNCREIVANILKYGFLVRWLPTMIDISENIMALSGSTVIILLAALAFKLELDRGAEFSIQWENRLKEMQILEYKHELQSNRHNIFRCSQLSNCRGLHSLSRPISHKESDLSENGKHITSNRVIDESKPSYLQNVMSIAEEHLRERIMQSQAISAELSGKMKQRIQDSEVVQTLLNEAQQIVDNFSGPLVNMCKNINIKVHETHAEFIHSIKTWCVVVAMLIVPNALIAKSMFDPIAALFLLLFSVTWAMKLISFFDVLRDLREVIVSDPASLRDIVPYDDERVSCLQYPRSLSITNFAIYLVAPTLCYQFNYPRKDRRDWWKIVKTTAQLIFSVILMKMIFEQYMTKILENTFGSTHQEHWMGFIGHFLERLLKLSVPTLYCWLLMFLSFFHYWFILLCEFCRFEDQQFYRDWWNSASFSEYWRKWNLPVHHFCIRHVYQPLLSKGLSRAWASQTVFIISAIGHEYVIAGSLQLGWTGLVFLAFALQTPLSVLTDMKYVRSRPVLGNAIFWITYCFTGQPTGVFVFYYLWQSRSGRMQTIQASKLKNMPLYRSEL